MSPSMRETSDPVCVRVKNASGCRSKCRNTLVRSSSTRLSPIHCEYHDFTNLAPASTSASPATASASVTTTPSRCRRMPSSMTSRKISGLTTMMAESTAAMTASSTIGRRYRRRYGQTLRTVPGRTCCQPTSSSRYRNQNSGPEIMRSTIPRTPHRAATHFHRPAGIPGSPGKVKPAGSLPPRSPLTGSSSPPPSPSPVVPPVSSRNQWAQNYICDFRYSSPCRHNHKVPGKE